MNKRIIVSNPDGSVSIIIPIASSGLTVEEIAVKDSGGLPYVIVDEAAVPTDRVFRSAWKTDPVNIIAVDVTKAKNLTHEMRRAKRAAEFAPHDEVISKQIPGTDFTVAETARATIRARYSTIQESIDACSTITSLKAVIDTEGL